MKVEVSVKGIDEALAVTNPQIVKAAAYQAVTRTLRSGRAAVSRVTRDIYNINKSDFDKRVRLRYPASYDDVSGTIEISGGVNDFVHGTPLISFKAVSYQMSGSNLLKLKKAKGEYSQKAMKRQRDLGVYAQVLKSGGKGFSKNGFIIPGAKGSWQVVRRIPGKKGKEGLKEMRVLTPASMVGSLRHGVITTVEKNLQDSLQKEFLHQLEYYQSLAAQGKRIGGVGKR